MARLAKPDAPLPRLRGAVAFRFPVRSGGDKQPCAAPGVCPSGRELPGTKGRERRLCRLYFRLAARFQPETVVDYGENDRSPSTVYIAKGAPAHR